MPVVTALQLNFAEMSKGILGVFSVFGGIAFNFVTYAE